MNDQTAPTLSRRQRFDRQHENQEQPKKEPRPKSHGGLVVIFGLAVVSLISVGACLWIDEKFTKNGEDNI